MENVRDTQFVQFCCRKASRHPGAPRARLPVMRSFWMPKVSQKGPLGAEVPSRGKESGCVAAVIFSYMWDRYKGARRRVGESDEREGEMRGGGIKNVGLFGRKLHRLS